MKRPCALLLALAVPLLILSCHRANPPANPPAGRMSLDDQFADLALRDLKAYGPSPDIANYVSRWDESVWRRRTEFVDTVAPWLKSDDAGKAAPAIGILRWICGYRPQGPVSVSWDQDNKKFYERIDKLVLPRIDHFHALKSDAVLHQLALYLGSRRTGPAKDELKRIIADPLAKDAKEQALIAIAWFRDPNDMDFLLPFMLEDSSAAPSLPYHFRTGYGDAAIPCLKKALATAARIHTRMQAAGELIHLRVPQGFAYLHDLALGTGAATDATTADRTWAGCFASDYLGLPRKETSPERIAAFILKRQKELCEAPAEESPR